MNFPSTHWSILRDATMSGGDRAKAALDEVCRRYWVPVFQTIVQRRYPEAEAQDLTQEFIVKLTDSSLWRRADPNRGRFRSFLLGALARFLREIEVRRRAQKRGGAVTHLSADDARIADTMPDTEFTEEIVRNFDRNWALGIMNEALLRTRAEYAAAGKLTLFEALKTFLPAGKEPPGYGPLAEKLGLHLATLKTEIHRLRIAFKANVRSEVAQTVSAPHEIEAELGWLQHILMDRGSRLNGAEAA